MNTPSQARIDAALRLAAPEPAQEGESRTEADDNVCPKCGGSKSLCEYRERAAKEW